MGRKPKKDGPPKSHTSPRKQKPARDAEAEEESQEQSEQRDELAEGDATGDGEKTEKQVGTVWTPEQDEQIAAFFEDNPLFYDMANSEYKNKKKRENLLLDLARTMFQSGKCKFSLKFIFLTFFVINLLRNFVHFPNLFRHEFVAQFCYLAKGLQHYKWQMYPASCPSENFVCSANYVRGLPSELQSQ